MAEVKIGVNAGGSNVASAIDQITASLNRMGRAVATANRLKFEPAGLEHTERDLERINRQFSTAVQRSKALRDALRQSGQQGRPLHQIDFNRLAVDPKQAQRMRDRAFTYSVEGTAWDLTNFEEEPTPAAPTPAPAGTSRPGRRVPSGGGRRGGSGGGGGQGGSGRGSGAGGHRSQGLGQRLGNSFLGGIGGGVGQIGQQGLSGAAARAAAGGGVIGGVTGLLGGLGLGALAFGAFKAGEGVSQGYGMAKDRDLSLDALKRQMGDLGVSFQQLKVMSDAASEGLGVNSKEFAQLEQQYEQSSHGADRSPLALAESTQFGVGFARSYGLDPGMSASFFGGMRQIDPRQSNRELAVLIADAINRTGGRALATDVMQAVQSFASVVSRMSLSSPNDAAFAGAYSSLLSAGGAGMTPDNAANILGSANAAVMGMGGAGEAGQNFMLQAFDRTGGGLRLNPVEARSLAAGGLFASRSSVFSSGALADYFKDDPEFKKLAGGIGADVTNFTSLKGKLDSDIADPWLRLDAAQRFFNLRSPEQAAALMNLSESGVGALGSALSKAGVQLNDVNGAGIQTLADIAGATSSGQLNSIYASLRGRQGAGALTGGEVNQLDAAQRSGNMEDFRTALIKVMASKDQEQTDASKMRDGIKSLENTQISIGDKMIGPLNVARDALLAIAGKDGKSATWEQLRQSAHQAELDDINSSTDAERSGILAAAAAQKAAVQKKIAALTPNQFTQPLSGLTKDGQEQRAAVAADAQAKIAPLEAQLKQIEQLTQAKLKDLEQQRADKLAASDRANQEAIADQKKLDDAMQGSLGRPLAARSDALTNRDGGSSPVGVRQNNPFDLRPVGSNIGFQSFGDMQSGIDAGLRNLLYAQNGHHRDTLTKIISAYAPSSDRNNTAKYISDVSEATGIGPNDKIDLNDPQMMRAVARAMLTAEGTGKSVSDKQLDTGIDSVLGNAQGRVDSSLRKLLSAQDKRGDDTLAKLVGSYLPSAGKSAAAKHLADVSKAIGVGANDKVDLHDPAMLRKVARALFDEDNSGKRISDSQIDTGVSDVLPKVPSAQRSALGRHQGVNDTLHVVIDANLKAAGASGATSLHQTKTSVDVPRGSGTQTVTVAG